MVFRLDDMQNILHGVRGSRFQDDSQYHPGSDVILNITPVRFNTTTVIYTPPPNAKISYLD